jgi:F0F1-type ATP synthase gamma subunit
LQETLLNAVTLKEDLTATKRDEEGAMGVFTDDKKHLVVLVTTDRGLCGSVNSSLTRSLRKELTESAKAGTDLRLFVLGEKGRAQVARDYAPITSRVIDAY